MIDGIRITSLTNIGSNLTYTTVFPVVDITGNAITNKANLQIIGNYILNQAGGANMVRAAQANLALSVANAAQPNITSVGTLTSLAVSGNSNITGNLNIAVNRLKIPGGTNGYVLQTDGTGNLTWTAQTGNGGGNGSPGGSNSQIQFNDAGSFGGDFGLTYNKTTDTLTAVTINAADVDLTGNVNANWVIGDYISGNGHNLFYIPGANINGAVPSATVAATVTTNAQPNITSVGTLANASVTGNVTAGNVYANSGTIGASRLTGTLTTNAQPNITSVGTLNSLSVTGNASANYFVGVATEVVVEAVNNNYSYHMAFVTGAGDTTLHMDNDDNLQYNPSSGLLTANRIDVDYLSVDTNIISNLIPFSNVTQNIGNNTNRWNDLYLANSTIYLGDATISATGNTIVVSNIEITDGNIGTIGNVAASNFDGNSSNVLYGNGVFSSVGSPFNQDLNTTDNVTFANITSTDAIRFSNSGNIVGAMGYAPNYVAIEGYGSNSVNITANDVYSWSFDGNGNLTIPNGGNINFVNTGGITQAVNEDLRFTVSDDEEDGWAIQSIVNDGAGNNLTQMQVRYDGVRINTDMPNNNYSFDFRDTGEFDVPKSIRGPVGGNLIIECGDASGSNTFIDLQTRSHVGDALISNIHIANPDVTISTSSEAYNWTFGGNGLLTLPDGAIIDTTGNNFEVRAVENTNFEANAVVNIYTDTSNNGWQWQFDDSGKLNLAGGGSIIESLANSSLDPTNPNVSTMVLTPDSNYTSQILVLDPTAPGHLHLRTFASSNIDQPNANLFLGGEETAFEVTSGSGNEARIHSGNNTWKYGNDGVLTFPRDAIGNTDPYLVIEGGSNPAINSVDASLGGPANLQISTNYLNFTGFTGATVTVRADDGSIGGSSNLSMTLNAYDDGDSPAVQMINWNANSGIPTTIVSAEPDKLEISTAINTINPYSWSFANTGNFTTPGNIIIPNAGGIYFANGVSYGGGGGSNISNGNSNVNIATSGGNVEIVSAGNAVANITGTGANITGTLNVTGNLTAGNIVAPLANGNSNISITANANVIISTTGNLGVMDIGADGRVRMLTGAKQIGGNIANSEGYIQFTTGSLTYFAGNVQLLGGGYIKGPAGVNVIQLNSPENGSARISNNFAVGSSNTGNITAGNITLSGNISGNTNGYTLGYLNIPQVSASNTTLALTDAGKHYYSTTAGNLTLTIPLNSSVAFPTGTAISIVVQAAGNVLVNAASGVTLYLAGSSSAGNRVVGTYGMATLMKVATDTWFINGTGVS